MSPDELFIFSPKPAPPQPSRVRKQQFFSHSWSNQRPWCCLLISLSHMLKKKNPCWFYLKSIRQPTTSLHSSYHPGSDPIIPQQGLPRSLLTGLSAPSFVPTVCLACSIQKGPFQRQSPPTAPHGLRAKVLKITSTKLVLFRLWPPFPIFSRSCALFQPQGLLGGF